MTVFVTLAQQLIPTATKTSAYTASVNDFVIVDGSSSSVPITLPTAPADLSMVGVKRNDATYNSANVPTVNLGGTTDRFLGGSSTAHQLLLQGQAAIYQYEAAIGQWITRSTDEPLSQLDLRYLNQNTTGTAAGITGKTTPSGALVGTTDTQALTHKDLTDATNTFPTLNQNTTGTAAGITGKTNPSGALVGTTDTQALTHKDLTDATNSFPTLNQSTTGNAATATKLATARNVNGTLFDGSADVLIPPLHAFSPADYGWISWSGDPLSAYSNAAFSVAGDVFFTLLPIRAATTITNVIMYVAVAGATLTSGQNFAGLYTGAGTLLASTADQSTNWTSTGLKTMALASSQAVSAGLYYVAFFQNGTTLPKFTYNAAVNALTANSLTYPRYGIDVTHTGRTTTFPSSATIAASQSNGPWVAVS